MISKIFANIIHMKRLDIKSRFSNVEITDFFFYFPSYNTFRIFLIKSININKRYGKYNPCVGYLCVKTESLISSWQSLKNDCVAVAKECF